MELNLLAPINTLGYGYVGYNLAIALHHMSHKVSLFPIGGQVEESLLNDPIKQMIEHGKLFNPNADAIRVWHQHDMSHFVGKGQHIGFPIFELDKFSDVERHHLNSCDKLFVTSEWAAEVCEKNHIEPSVFIVPLGVDTSVFKPTPMNKGTTVFLNCGKWELRKGHDVLIKAFKKAFTKDDDVLLMMCNSNPFLNGVQTDRWKKLYEHPKIRFIPRLQTSAEVAKLMGMADCGIFPSRAEGWNLEALEMLACGRHLIITNYSAHKQFCNSENSMLVDINGTESANDGIWFKGQGNWASIGERQIDQLAGYLRDTHLLKQKGNLEQNTSGIETAQQFSWINTAASAIGGINGITNLGNKT